MAHFVRHQKINPNSLPCGPIARRALPAGAHWQSRQPSPLWGKENDSAALEGVSWRLKIRPFLREMHQSDGDLDVASNLGFLPGPSFCPERLASLRACFPPVKSSNQGSWREELPVRKNQRGLVFPIYALLGP